MVTLRNNIDNVKMDPSAPLQVMIYLLLYFKIFIFENICFNLLYSDFLFIIEEKLEIYLYVSISV